MENVIRIHPDDNVLVALRDLNELETIVKDGNAYQLFERIPAKHKFFSCDLQKGERVIMYGVTIGIVKSDVRVGYRVSIENTKHDAEPFSYRAEQYNWTPPDISDFADRTFLGYLRDDGKVGTANYWLFVPTVFCENRNLDVIKDALQKELGYDTSQKYRAYAKSLVNAYKNGVDLQTTTLDALEKDPMFERVFQNVDGVKFLNHQGGCGGTRQDADTLANLLAAYADHPNVAGVTVLSLGCQHLQMSIFEEALYAKSPGFSKPIILFEQQQSLSEEEMISKAIRQTFEGLIKVNKQYRQPVSLSKLCIGVKCGGSDGFSGLSANPAVGYAADLVVALGGSILLAEFPELCGVEQNLIDRCVSKEVAEKFIQLMNDYNKQAHAVGSGFHMNPSPGNIRDGLITDAMKSAGAAQKGGTAPVVDVLDYTEIVQKPGLSLVCTPGNDVEATTGKAAAGANLILFTTGLGTPTGNVICPTIKLSTNSNLARKMRDIIDIDCGPVIDGNKSIEEMGKAILEYCIKVASGIIQPKAVLLNQDDFIPWKRGVSL